ncbi:MAG: hypothetical protein R3C42_03930 [Parvularculaceae bacterium]|nr:hypothetical protein [Parvularculaceae bacterium]
MVKSMDEEKLQRRLAGLTQTPVAAPPPTESENEARQRTDRTARRIDVFKQGRIVVPGSGEIACIITDWSENGARIRLDDVGGLPEFVSLKVTTAGVLKRARVIWRRANMAGLSFLIERKVRFGNGRM